VDQFNILIYDRVPISCRGWMLRWILCSRWVWPFTAPIRIGTLPSR